MIKDWEVKSLGDVCFFKSGNTIDPSLERIEGDVIYTKVGDMNIQGNEEFITTSSRYVNLKDIKENQLIPKGSIIFPKRGGAIATNKKRRITSLTIVDLNTMALVPGKEIDEDYLFFWFKQINLADLSNGTSIPQINNYSFDNVLISFPKDILEQKRIVKILDKKFELIDKLKSVTKQQLDSAKELFESRSEELLIGNEQWEEKTIDDVCILENGDRGKNYPSNAKLQTEGIPFVSAGNLQEQDIELKGRNFLNDKQFALLRSGKFTKGDILFCLRGSLGKYALVQSIVKGAIASSLVIVKPKKALVSKEYIMSYFGSGLCKKMIQKYAGGTAQPNLGAKDLKKFFINVPSIEEQKIICNELSLLKKETKVLESIFLRKITEIEELKKSYLHEAFSGKL